MHKKEWAAGNASRKWDMTYNTNKMRGSDFEVLEDLPDHLGNAILGLKTPVSLGIRVVEHIRPAVSNRLSQRVHFVFDLETGDVLLDLLGQLRRTE